LESLDQHKVPNWFNNAKFGIFIYWGVYSILGYAPKVDPREIWKKVKAGELTPKEAITIHSYAKWYWDTMKIQKWS